MFASRSSWVIPLWRLLLPHRQLAGKHLDGAIDRNLGYAGLGVRPPVMIELSLFFLALGWTQAGPSVDAAMKSAVRSQAFQARRRRQTILERAPALGLCERKT